MLDLTEPYDDTAIINGVKYEINMSFDNILKLHEMLSDKELTDAQQIVLGNIMLFGEDLKFDLHTQEEIFNQVYKEKINGDNSDNEVITDIAGNPMPAVDPDKDDGDNEKVMSFKQDAEYIYASFMQDYGIDLIEEQGSMHWSKFTALLHGLRDNTKLMKVIEIRTMEIPKGTKAKEKENIEKAKKRYKLKPE